MEQDTRRKLPSNMAYFEVTGGGLFWVTADSQVQIGSPPHTWGILRRTFTFCAHFRFTPTHVGNTAIKRLRSAQTPVHPHTRGEYRRFLTLFVDCGGSPPHTWGILLTIDWYDNRQRFTPTHVGNTYPNDGGCMKICGSPPHTWGIHVTKLQVTPSSRFTPTRVGNTQSCENDLFSATVHPHTRGEYN